MNFRFVLAELLSGLRITPMANARFSTQANALLRKNLIYQKRNKGLNICLIFFPIIICVLLVVLQLLINNLLDKPDYRCGCAIQSNGSKLCGLQYSTSEQAAFCQIDSPEKWPALLQIPAPEYRAARADFLSFSDLPDESCRSKGSCPVTLLFTGENQSLAQGLGAHMSSYGSMNLSDILGSMASNVLGTTSMPPDMNFIESAFSSDLPVYYLQSHCSSNLSFSVPITIASSSITQDVSCSPNTNLWRNSSSDINNELYKGYYRGNSERKINEITTAYDFLNSNEQNFNVNIWYNSTYNNDTGFSELYFPIALLRVPKSVNLATNAFLHSLLGPGSKILLKFVKEMPKSGTHLTLELSAILSAQFFVYIITLLFPVVLSFLVYEKENKLRMMMKMHGLGDGPYWLISYAYFVTLSLIYILFLVLFASLIGLQFFSMNDYGIQFVFYFIYVNLQVSLVFLVAPFFSNVLTAKVVGYLFVFITGLLGAWLFEFFVLDTSFSRKWITAMELYPGFALYRGLLEFGQYAFSAKYQETRGMMWNDLTDSYNGLKEVLVIMLVEWIIVLPLAFYVDQVASSGNGVAKSPLFFLPAFQKKHSLSSSQRRSLRRHGSSKVSVQMETPDVVQEREKVEQLLEEGNLSHSIICDSLVKVYPARDGNPPKGAVKGLSLVLPRGECFGILGPNGAGKTSFISMMIGLSEPTSGVAFVEGSNILTQMDQIYTSMGVCPQHDLLWGSLTAREHLLFYGRLKNLKGVDLAEAVEASLKSVNLFHGEVGDKQARKYSGGMKRRLSVAISLIGNPKVVYMDEPSTGLDPASRNNLWNVVKQAKQDRAVILTTHSMEEAEVLCDRLGIFVNGSLHCIGNPKELKGRYGSSFVFTITTSQSHENEVEAMVQSLSPNAQKIYHILGTQKFELPKHEVRISDVFEAVQGAKSRFTVFAWGLADTTLEDVFIKVAREAQASNALS